MASAERKLVEDALQKACGEWIRCNQKVLKLWELKTRPLLMVHLPFKIISMKWQITHSFTCSLIFTVNCKFKTKLDTNLHIKTERTQSDARKPPRLEMASISIIERCGPTERKVIFARPTFENLLSNKNSSLILHQPSKLFISHLIRFARMRNYLQFGLKRWEIDGIYSVMQTVC